VGALALCLGLTGGQINVLNVRVSAFSRPGGNRCYARFWKILLYGVTGLTILMSLPYLKAERVTWRILWVHLLASRMMVMVSVRLAHEIYLGTELMSFRLCDDRAQRSKPRSLEAAAKYFVWAPLLGILLYGISLLTGLAGSTKLQRSGRHRDSRADDPLVLIPTILWQSLRL